LGDASDPDRARENLVPDYGHDPIAVQAIAVWPKFQYAAEEASRRENIETVRKQIDTICDLTVSSFR
jgi:hypothetical protein